MSEKSCLLSEENHSIKELTFLEKKLYEHLYTSAYEGISKLHKQISVQIG